MTDMINATVTPQRQTWRGLIDVLEVGETLNIPLDKFNSVSNIVTMKFHIPTKKRFSVYYKDAPEGQAIVKRLSDAKK